MSEEPTPYNCSTPPRYETLVLWLAVALFAILNFARLPHEIADEGFHAPQVWLFTNGDYRITDGLTTIPTYHAAVAFLSRCAGLNSVTEWRIASSVVALLAIPLFYRLRKKLHPADAESRTQLFFLCPYLFPMFFVIYTDAWSLLFLLLSLERMLSGRPWQSAGAGLLALLIRQTNIIGLLFIVGLDYLRTHEGMPSRATILQFLRKHVGMILVGLLFAGFVVWNGGIAIHDKSQHPLSFNLANLHFFLLLQGLLFLPHVLQKGCQAVAEWWKQPWFFPVVGGFFLLYLATFHASHTFNDPGMHFYLRNRLLHFVLSDPVWKTLAFVPVCLALFSLWNSLRDHRETLLWLAFLLLSVAPFAVIEQRYYLPALAFWLVLGKPLEETSRRLLPLYFLGLDLWLAWQISRVEFFL